MTTLRSENLLPHSPQVWVALPGRHVERHGGDDDDDDDGVRVLDLVPIQVEDVLGRLTGVQLPLGSVPSRKEAEGLAPTTLRNQ